MEKKEVLWLLEELLKENEEKLKEKQKSMLKTQMERQLTLEDLDWD